MHEDDPIAAWPTVISCGALAILLLGLAAFMAWPLTLN